jgi:BolA protein
MSIKARLETALTARFRPVFLEVTDDSAQHAGHGGWRPEGSHFSATIVSAEFEGKTPVERHRMVYALLAEELKQAVHALALTTRTPAEWEKMQRPR